MQGTRTPDRETLELWYALGRLYSKASSTRSRSTRLGFTVALVSGALVLLSVPLFGTLWAGPFAPAIPAVLGLGAGLGMSLRRRLGVRRRERSIGGALAKKGFDARRPGENGLSAYYDAQLILLRSEYEYLSLRGAGSARLFEESFGFTSEDPFETGPLSVEPDTPEMAVLRERWEKRLSMQKARGQEPPEMGLREDIAYRVFPREMTVPAEMATREAYLAISRGLIKKRYGREKKVGSEALREGIRRDLDEYERLTRRTSRPRRRGARSGQSPTGRS